MNIDQKLSLKNNQNKLKQIMKCKLYFKDYKYILMIIKNHIQKLQIINIKIFNIIYLKLLIIFLALKS